MPNERIGRAVQQAAKRDLRLTPTWLKIEPLNRDWLTIPLPQIPEPGPPKTFDVPFDWADHLPKSSDEG